VHTVYHRQQRGAVDSESLAFSQYGTRIRDWVRSRIHRAFTTTTTTVRNEQLAALALRHAVPAVYQGRKFAAAGGLASYGRFLVLPANLAPAVAFTKARPFASTRPARSLY